MELIVEWTFEGSLKSKKNEREYGVSGTKPVINKECMLVHERGQKTVEVEWYRVNIELLPPQSVKG